jgi:hypothetical protein
MKYLKNCSFCFKQQLLTQNEMRNKDTTHLLLVYMNLKKNNCMLISYLNVWTSLTFDPSCDISIMITT